MSKPNFTVGDIVVKKNWKRDPPFGGLPFFEDNPMIHAAGEIVSCADFVLLRLFVGISVEFGYQTLLNDFRYLKRDEAKMFLTPAYLRYGEIEPRIIAKVRLEHNL